jgi:hypothetical protein
VYVVEDMMVELVGGEVVREMMAQGLVDAEVCREVSKAVVEEGCAHVEVAARTGARVLACQVRIGYKGRQAME